MESDGNVLKAGRRDDNPENDANVHLFEARTQEDTGQRSFRKTPRPGLRFPHEEAWWWHHDDDDDDGSLDSRFIPLGSFYDGSMDGQTRVFQY